MTLELYIALLSFAFVSVITPGPNNLMLMASGLNFGWRRSIPHMFGVGLGFPLMLLLVGLGLVQVFETYPILKQVMTVCSILYLIYLAWNVANAAPAKEGPAVGKPLTLFQATSFQWVNPKAWTMALTAITIYAPDRSVWTIGAVALAFGAVNLPSVSTWTVLGQQMKRVLTNPNRLRAFNWTMATLLLATLWPALT